MDLDTINSNFETYCELLMREDEYQKVKNTIYSILTHIDNELYPIYKDFPNENTAIKFLNKSEYNNFYINELKNFYIIDKTDFNNQLIQDNIELKTILFYLYAVSHTDNDIDKETIKALFELIKSIILSNLENKTIIHEATYSSDKSLKDNHEKIGYQNYRVFYATDRKAEKNNTLIKKYTNERSTSLTFGYCNVLIPKSHKTGELTGSLIEKIIHLDFSYGDIKLEKIVDCTENNFWRILNTVIPRTNDEAMIFIHGYNTSFEGAAIRTAQIAYDLKIKGPVAFFSWPSKNKFTAYSADEATIQVSKKYIKNFIEDFATKTQIKKIHIIAHSMGNRALLDIADSLQNKDIQFGQIILAAPDIDKDLFEQLADAFPKLGDRTTLYVSPLDKAVFASNIKHQAPRVGFVPPVTVIKEIDTIKVELGIELFDLQHSYIANTWSVLSDMYSLLHNNYNPSERTGIVPQNNYWVLK